MATITEVAKKANVSKMTVSRVINNPDKVSGELQELVKQAMKDVGYEPNYVARSLVQNKTRIVRFIVSEDVNTTEPYFMNLLAGVSKRLSQDYYSMQVIYDEKWDIGKVDGIIYTGNRTETLNRLKEEKLPVVVFGESDFDFDMVDINNEKGTSVATEFFYQQGLKNIVYLGINRKEAFALNRKKGYYNFMVEHGLSPLIYEVRNRSTSAKDTVAEILQERTDEEHIAFVCATDRIALGVLRAAREFDLHVPEDVSVIGFDGVFLDQVAYPKLTTIKQPLLEMGERLSEKIIAKIESGEENIENHIEYFEPILVVRDSTK